MNDDRNNVPPGGGAAYSLAHVRFVEPIPSMEVYDAESLKARAANAEAEAARLREQLEAADDRLAECEERVDHLRNLRGQLDAANARLAEREEEIERLRRAALRELSNEADELGDYTL